MSLTSWIANFISPQFSNVTPANNPISLSHLSSRGDGGHNRTGIRKWERKRDIDTMEEEEARHPYIHVCSRNT